MNEAIEAAGQIADRAGDSSGVVYILLIFVIIIGTIAVYFYHQQAATRKEQIKELKEEKKALQEKYDVLQSEYVTLGEKAIESQINNSEMLKQLMGSLSNVPKDVLAEIKEMYIKVNQDITKGLNQIDQKTDEKIDKVASFQSRLIEKIKA